MRKISLAVLSLPLVLEAYTDCSAIGVGADYLYMRRSQVEHHRIITNNANDPHTLVSTRDLVDDFEWKSGVQGFITYSPIPDSTIEASYSYIFPWKGEEIVNPGPTLEFPFVASNFTVDFVNGTAAVVQLKSSLQWAELNYWGHVTPRRCNYFSFSYLIGGRWFFLKEFFELQSVADLDLSSYIIKTYNHLYGIQLGASLEVNPSKRWTWNFQLRGAGFLNTAKNHPVMTDENATITIVDYTKERWKDTYLIEGLASLSYHWGDLVSIQVGYQGFMLTGVALATNQLHVSTRGKRRVNMRGDIVVDGAFAGITLNY